MSNTNQFGTAQPYIASYVLVKKDGKIAFVLRSNTGWMNNHYGLPSGKVEEGETFTEAAIREAKEEVGITLRPENLHQVLTGHRREQGDTMSWVDVFFEAAEWEGEVINAEPHMHSAVEWFSLDNLPENIIPSVRYYLEKVQAADTYCEYWF